MGSNPTLSAIFYHGSLPNLSCPWKEISRTENEDGRDRMLDGRPRILIIRLSAIGDVVRVLPVLRNLRRQFPQAQIDWVVESKAAGVVEGHPDLDDVLVFERSPKFLESTKTFRRLCRRVQSNQYDIVLDFHGIAKSGLIAWSSRAPERYGFAAPRGQEGSYLALTHRVKLPSPDLNRVEENLLLCDEVAGRVNPADATIFVPEDAQEHVNEFFDAEFEGGKLVVAMHAPVDRKEKQWPLPYYSELADMLLADGRFDVFLTWGPGQFDIAAGVAANCRRNPTLAPETTDLKMLAWLLHRSDLYFGGDTGPMHIAATMDTAVIAVFGGTDPRKHAPYNKRSKVLYVEPKGTKPEADAVKRLEMITPEKAYDACVEFVRREFLERSE